MDGTVILPGPEAIVLFGVHVKVFSAVFGLFGVGLGHAMAPAAPERIGWRRQAAVVAAGVLLAICITIATGQNPLVVFGWSVGIGFAGITIFQISAANAASAARSIGSAALQELSERLAERKDNP